MLHALLEYTMHGNMPPIIEDSKSSMTTADSNGEKPLRREGIQIYLFISIYIYIFIYKVQYLLIQRLGAYCL